MKIRNYTELYIFIFLFIISGYLNSILFKPKFEIPMQDKSLNFNSNLLSVFDLGQKRLISDIIWISTLLDADTLHYKKKDLNSWLFLRFNLISDLDPFFKINYSFGAQYLSVVKDDVIGATKLIEKALKIFPDDYNLNFIAGYIYTFELNDYEKAYKHYAKIQQFPQAPGFIKSLLGKLRYKLTNNIHIAYETVLELYNQIDKNSPIADKLKSDLYSLKAEIDLECLNKKYTKCEKTDFSGNPYIKDGNTYRSSIEFKKYELYKKRAGN